MNVLCGAEQRSVESMDQRYEYKMLNVFTVYCAHRIISTACPSRHKLSIGLMEGEKAWCLLWREELSE